MIAPSIWLSIALLKADLCCCSKRLKMLTVWEVKWRLWHLSKKRCITFKSESEAPYTARPYVRMGRTRVLNKWSIFYAYLWSIGPCNRQYFGSSAGSTVLKVLNKISDHSTPPTDHRTGLCEQQSCKQESTIQISRWATLENGCYVLIMKLECLLCLFSHYFQSSPSGV